MRKVDACDMASEARCSHCDDKCLGGMIMLIRLDISMSPNASPESRKLAQDLIKDFQRMIDEAAHES